MHLSASTGGYSTEHALSHAQPTASSLVVTRRRLAKRLAQLMWPGRNHVVAARQFRIGSTVRNRNLRVITHFFLVSSGGLQSSQVYRHTLHNSAGHHRHVTHSSHDTTHSMVHSGSIAATSGKTKSASPSCCAPVGWNVICSIRTIAERRVGRLLQVCMRHERGHWSRRRLRRARTATTIAMYRPRSCRGRL